ncbi:MAG: 23S rRNA (adenine(2503)-C(2))-methyltransferase RlmN [Candidatus Gracilibacteria bacterium]
MISTEDLIKNLAEKKIPRFRALQIIHAVCKEGKTEYSSISTLPQSMQELLEKELPILSLKPVRQLTSTDGSTTKTLFELKDGLKIEAVLMFFQDGRHTVCISSQAGCQLGCKFCATGTMKFGRNLTYEEIADQVLFYAQQLHHQQKRISNIVLMGMGEPFMNYDNVMKALHVINDQEGLNIGARNITVSTSGICPGIEKLMEEDLQVNLAVSLHAPNQELRKRIMPVANMYSLEKLMTALKNYLEKTHRRISYEYVMLKGINDGEEQAHELGKLIKGQLCHVNLIPYNATGIAGIEGTLQEKIKKFRDIVKEYGVPVTIRVTLGQEIAAACGQLANKDAKNEKK